MWIFEWLPDIVIHIIFITGALGIFAGFILTFIPFVKQYKLAIQIASLFIFALGVYLEGGLADNKEWQFKIKELEGKLAVAEERSKTANVVIEEKIVTKTNVVKQKGQDIIKYIDKWQTKEILTEVPGPERIRVEEVIKYIENCPVPKEIIDTHNAAALMNKAAEGSNK
jgi:hypothetical protein